MDPLRPARHDLVIERAGAPTLSLSVRKTGSPSAAATGDRIQPWAEIDAERILAWATDEAMEAAEAGRSTRLEWKASAGDLGTGVCRACADAAEAERERSDAAAVEKARRDAARRQALIAQARSLLETHGRIETSPCPHHPGLRRQVTVADRYDRMETDLVSPNGERWDLALMRGSSVALGILLVRDDAMIDPNDPERRARNPGATYFVAVPIESPVDPVTGAIRTNCWHLAHPGECPACDYFAKATRIIREVADHIATMIAPKKTPRTWWEIRGMFRQRVAEAFRRDRLVPVEPDSARDVDALAVRAVRDLRRRSSDAWPGHSETVAAGLRERDRRAKTMSDPFRNVVPHGPHVRLPSLGSPSIAYRKEWDALVAEAGRRVGTDASREAEEIATLLDDIGATLGASPFNATRGVLMLQIARKAAAVPVGTLPAEVLQRLRQSVPGG